MNLKGLSLRAKFIIITSLITAVLLGFGFFIVSMIGQLANVTADIIDHPLEVSNAAYYANIEVLRMDRDLEFLLLVEEAYEINIIVDRIRVSESKVYVALDTIAYNILGEEGKVLQEDALELFVEWKSIRSEIIQLIRDDDREGAYTIAQTKGADHIDSIERKFGELNSYAINKAVEFQENSKYLESRTERTTIIGIILVFIIVALLILWISWDVLTGINSLSHSLHDIIKSGEFKNVNLQGDDELSALSDIFNELVTSIGTQLWVKEGNRKMNSILSMDMPFENKLQFYVNDLCDYGDYLSVAYYHLEEKELVMRAWVNRIDILERNYLIGDKMVGECAMKNELSYIDFEERFDDVRKKMPYAGIFNVPVEVNDVVYGVMSIVLKKNRTEASQEFVEESIKDFSTFVGDYVQRDRIDLLLEDSIQTNEQLTIRQVRLEENTNQLEAANMALQEQRDLLNTKSEELVRQNKELVNLREELVKKYKDLEEVTEYRSQFLTNISHELRTPLNSIIVLSNILKGQKGSNQHEDLNKIEVINKAANELLLTINDILDLSKVESGNIEVEKTLFRPVQLINEMKAIYEPLIIDKGLESYFAVDSEYNVYGDKAKISHIITNFVSNAIKFTKTGSISVTFSDNPEDEEFPLRIDVTDTGIGITEEKFEAIFDEFVQENGAISRQYGGTGLGLSISKNYALLIEAKILLDSKLGSGSTFSLLLPKECISHDRVIADKKETENSPLNIINKHILYDEFKGTKVLICDDEPMNIFALSTMFEDIGVAPIVAFNRQEAKKLLDEHKDIRFIFMDYMMPEDKGGNCVQVLQSDDRYNGIPVSIITAAELSTDEEQWIRDIGLMLMHKPVDYNELVDLLNEYLG